MRSILQVAFFRVEEAAVWGVEQEWVVGRARVGGRVPGWAEVVGVEWGCAVLERAAGWAAVSARP